MLLSTLLEKSVVKAKLLQGKFVTIQDIQYDSRRVKLGDLFCVLNGGHSHAKLYINEALQKGASAILIEQSVYQAFHNITFSNVGIVVVADNSVRREMSRLAKTFFTQNINYPIIVGITGTDGKTTSISFIHQLATMLNVKAGYWSTIDFYDGNKVHQNKYRQSTPESPDIFRCLSIMANNDCKLAFFESTSHGLSHKTMRMIDIQFNYAGISNIGSEHLDFHKTVEQYVKDKSNILMQLVSPNDNGTVNTKKTADLFSIEKSKQQGKGIIRYEEAHKELLVHTIQKANAKLLTYSLHHKNADYYFETTEKTLHYSKGIVCYQKSQLTYKVCLNCFGEYNIENALLAIAILHNYLCDYCYEEENEALQRICRYISMLQMPKGRMQVLQHTQPFTVIVDYAHTPQSFHALLPLVAKYTEGNLIVVFGSAGERDVQKRSEQGVIADQYAHSIVLTDEDPRGEDSMEILTQIAEGCKTHIKDKNLFLIPNREKAIAHAISLAKKKDCVLCLGKGHEKTIEYATQTVQWDEIGIALKYLGILH